jgi:MFS family permease
VTPDTDDTEPEGHITESAAARGVATEQAARTTFRDVFAVAEFRALWSAQLLSVAGDQLARVALTVLVYDRTRSALLAAITFVASVVPTFVGGVTLAWLADRYPRRGVMIACDLVRCGLVLVMAIRGMPVAAMVVLLFVVTLVSAPFTSARAAVYPDVLTGDRYVVGTAVTMITNQFAQVIGFAAGGAIAGLLGTSQALVVDAATFAGSAIIVRAWVRNRPPPVRPPPSAAPLVSANTGRPRPRHAKARTGLGSGLGSGVRLVFGNPVLRTSMLFGWLAAFYNSPEGVVTPLAHSLGGGATAVGIILAAQALGETTGAFVFSRFITPDLRLRLMGPMAVASCVLLLFFAFRPGLTGTIVVLCLSGLCAAYQLAANAAFVSATPHDRRSQAFGLAQGGMSFGQGTVMIIAGAVAEAVHPAAIIAVCGGIGSLAAVALAGSWSHRRARSAMSIRALSPADGTHDRGPLLLHVQ